MLETLKCLKLSDNAVLPTRTHSTDAGVDLYSAEDTFIEVGYTKKIKTDIAICIPESYVGKIEGRSSMNSKGVMALGGVIDAGYNGEIGVILHNLSFDNDELNASPYPGRFKFGKMIKKGDKIAQMLVYKVETQPIQEVNELWTSERGSKGFGSSGV